MPAPHTRERPSLQLPPVPFPLLELPEAARVRALGTTAVVAVTEVTRRDEAVAILTAELDAIDHACSRALADSELARLNRAAGRWTAVSRLFLTALDVGLTAARATEGLVDPTRRRIRGERGGGWAAIEVDEAGRRVRLPRTVELDLGATVKAFAADRVAQRIATATGAGVIVHVGGDCSIAGPPPAGGWAVRLSDRPDAWSRDPAGTITLDAGGVASLRAIPRRRVRAGRESPVDSVWQIVTAAAPTCVDAAVATTAAVALGIAAPRWLKARGVAARLIRPDGTTLVLGTWPAAASAA